VTVQPVAPAVPAETAEELYEHAPCGYLSTDPDGLVTRINATLLGWLGYRREQVVGVLRFADLLTVGGRIYHETHFAPLLRMQGEVGGVAFDLQGADGRRLPALATSVLVTAPDGQPLRIRTSLFDARGRRAYERELLRARRDADLERDRVQQLVATLQRSLLPPVLPAVPGLDAVAYYHAASPDQLSGDFYDLFPLPGGRWGLFLGDVCGKGAEAAALTSLARYTLRAVAVQEPDPVAALHVLDTVLQQQYTSADARFCTVVVGLLVPQGDGFAVELAAGGHPYPLLLRAGGTAEYRSTSGGQLVGAVPGAQFVTNRFGLEPGDTLLLYTDGLVEMRVAGRDRYDEEALLEFARALAPATAAATVAAVRTLLGGAAEVDDDTAVLALGVPARR
jgi:phosphoserine phosphatase RsbU/P